MILILYTCIGDQTFVDHFRVKAMNFDSHVGLLEGLGMIF
jgi:hypothetical protein